MIQYLCQSKIGYVTNDVYFSSPYFFMQIFNIYVTYLQSIERLKNAFISQSIKYKPIFNMCIGRKVVKLKMM